MVNETFKKVEARLYDIYRKQKEILNIERECENLELHGEMIKKDIQNTNIDIDAHINVGVNYSSINVQACSNGDSYMDKEIVRAITRLEEEFRYVRRKILKKRQRIREIERNIIHIKNNIDNLSAENKTFIELKYGKGKSVTEVADHLSMGKTTAYRKRDELIGMISKWNNVG